MGRNHKILNLAEIAAAKAARPEVFKPQFVNGKWRDPKFSRREIANIRKRILMAGGKWAWDIPHKVVEKKVQFKGHKRDMVRIDREERIKRCMARMPKLVEEYRKERRQQRTEKKKKNGGLLWLLSQPRDV